MNSNDVSVSSNDIMDEYVTEHPGKLISREYIQKEIV